MEALDSTVINTAIPAMATSLAVEPVDLKIALISYLLSLAVFVPISGWLADKFGSKQLFLTALVIFTLSSLWCGFAHTLIELVITRLLQGLGGALGLPVGRLILIRTFGRENLLKIMSQVVALGSLGMMLGPVIGGVITEHLSWNWIFWINIPVGIFTFVLGIYCLPHTKPKRVAPLDKLGFVLFGAALSGLTFGLAELSETMISAFASCITLVVSVFLLIIYAIHSHHQLHPIVKTDLLALRTFRISVIGNLLSRLGFGGVPFLLPLLLQIGLGYSAELSGLLLAPMAVGVLVAKQLALSALRYLGYKKLLIYNTILVGFVLWSFTLVNSTMSIGIIALLTFVYGAVISLQYSSMNSLGYADLSPDDLSAGTSIFSTLQQLAQSFGVALSAILIRVFSYFFAQDGVLSVPIFHYTFLAVACLTILSSLIFLKLSDEDGRQMIHP
jgi:EmrB/QacA subfamily drug resistance transporter